MRYRYSLWDPIVLMLTALQLYGAWWVMRHAGSEIPLHWGPAGTPDRFGPPELGPMLIPAAFAFGFYVAFRLLDGWMLSRKPEAYGFLTAFAGGFALVMAVVRVTMGKGFVISGLLAAGLGLLPGAWSMAALAPFVFGPLVAISAAIARAPSKSSRK